MQVRNCDKCGVQTDAPTLCPSCMLATLPPFNELKPHARYRIIKHDKFNWAIQEYQEGGGEISRGRYAGEVKQAKWKQPSEFYNSLQGAAKGLLQKAAGDALLAQEATNILDALKLAEQRVLATLAVADMGIPQPPPLSETPHAD